MLYQPTIGLEIHTELKTNSKMFCSCKNDSQEKEPNVNICPICLGHPGTLPVINEEAVKKVIKTGLALDCKIALASRFERKNYFYPDLPKGYQISQYALPLCQNGFLQIGNRKIRIERIHLEEDTARLVHKKDGSLLDFNRAGIPLMELVTEPDIISADEAYNFAKELQLILRYLGVSDADMEKGQMRAEVNISLLPQNQKSKIKNQKLGIKVEVKNLNSFRAVRKAIEYEIKRQAEALDAGEQVVQETRGWDEKKQATVSQRSKEEAHDYRYFPEPDLPPLNFNKEYVQDIKAEIPELPQSKRIRFKSEYGLKDADIEMFVSNKDLSEYFEQVVSEFREWTKTKEGVEAIDDKSFKELVQVASNYMISDLMGLLAGMSVEDEKFLITPENFAEFISLLYRKEITSKIGKIVLKEMFEKGADPSDVIKTRGLAKMEDEGELEKIISDVVSQNPRAVKDFKDGKENALQFLIGQAMAESRGKANPETLRELFTKLLK